MHISELKIDGYKNCREKSIISLNPGLNILVGENTSGKTTIIDAIRMILRDSEQGYVIGDDFYKSFDKEE
ncbi:MAG: AAA family ATPase [Lachnospiraceae bacterium]|nr:AAA family ATPase [Lachnospiraceae bacterium]